MANGAVAIKVFLPTSFTKEVGAKKLSIAIAPAYFLCKESKQRNF